MGLKILALPAGVLPEVPAVSVTYQRGWDTARELPVIMFAIVGGERPILVDTGTPDPDFVRTHHHAGFTRPDEHSPARVLEGAGIDPSRVHDVIFTHLHWAHCGNVELFPDAEFHVQDDELRYAIDPIELHRRDYQRTRDANPEWLSVLSRIRPVSGAVEIAPGVSTVPLPGHTPGSQGVLVDTDAGRHLLAGDCVYSYENWVDGRRPERIPSGTFSNLIQHTASFERIESLNCQVIPAHDAKVLETAVFG
jgi:N-acyl homoserine lactone hydrolase